MQLDQLIATLHGLRGSGGWGRLAKDSGVNYFTIARIARGEIASPGIKTVEKLVAALPAEGAQPVADETKAA